MRSRLAAQRRAAPTAPTAPKAPSDGVYVTAAGLAALEGHARHLAFRPRHKTHNLLSGRHGSRLRGRGLDFEELRQSLPGDDVRTIDWHVTARTQKPFVRVYTEEKDRPVIVAVDQRINMFFGSTRSMKSVTAAEAAALCVWRALGDGDRVGGVVFDDARVYDQRPDRNRAGAMRLLGQVTACNNALRADAGTTRNPYQLDAALDAVARAVNHDHFVVVVTDCDGHGPRTRDLLRRIAMRNDVVLLLVYDPFMVNVPASRDLVITDGELQVEVRLSTGRVRTPLAEAADRRMKEILGWQREIGVTVAPISTAEDTSAQLRHLIGSRRAMR